MKNFSKYILLVVVALGLIVIANAKMPLWRRLVDKVKQSLRKVKQGGKEECSDSAAGAVSDHTSQQSEIPIIDISGLVSADATQESKKAVAAQLVQACEDIGFFVITGHGVPQSVIDNMWSNTSAFFDLPEEYKSKWEEGKQSAYPFGYSGIGGEVLSAGKDEETKQDSKNLPDLKELFSLGPANKRAGFPARKWPDQPATFQASWTVYYDTLAELASKILAGFAIGLGREEWFFQQFITHHASAVRALNYPSYEGYVPPPGQLRASAHTDYGTITILKSGGPGLQVSKDEQPPRWVAVPFLEDAFVVNLGDLMRRWTNDRWLSTLHRVVNPESGEQWQRRQSIAFFHNPNRDAQVEPLTMGDDEPLHDPIIAGDFLMQKHLAAVGGDK